MNSSPTRDQWALLAFLRFFLAATVFYGHYSLLVKIDPLDIFGDSYLNPGSCVLGFFILSGFSIAASVEREASGFYRRRILRIWPLYIAVIVFGLIIMLWVPVKFRLPIGGLMRQPSTLQIVASVLMLQNIIAFPIPIVAPIWSLSAEWWHYMAAPVINKLSKTILVQWIILSLIAFFYMATPVHRGIEALNYGWAIIVSSWLWITGFLYYKLRGTAKGFFILAAPAMLALPTRHFVGEPLMITIMVLVASSEVRLSSRYINIFNFLGDLSYPLYLFHIPCIVLALVLGMTNTGGILAATLLVSMLALLLVDYPCRKLFAMKKAETKVLVNAEI